jgi:hypothetical protein
MSCTEYVASILFVCTKGHLHEDAFGALLPDPTQFRRLLPEVRGRWLALAAETIERAGLVDAELTAQPAAGSRR